MAFKGLWKGLAISGSRVLGDVQDGSLEVQALGLKFMDGDWDFGRFSRGVRLERFGFSSCLKYKQRRIGFKV